MRIINKWVSAIKEDLDRIDDIGEEIHKELPEDIGIFRERMDLFPEGIKVLKISNKVVGYAIFHPWIVYNIPRLNTYIGNIPNMVNCFYLHDITILPEFRGRGMSEKLIEGIDDLYVTRYKNCFFTTLVAVYGTERLWKRYGFRVVEEEGDGRIEGSLKTYGDGAKYMIRENK